MNPNNHIASPVEVVIPHQQSVQVVQEEQMIEAKHWTELHPTFKAENRLRADGRIFHSVDKNGKPYGTSVSPYLDLFHTQIEEEIAPVIMALKDKGYFTVSSCAGHPKRSHVTLCFPCTEGRDLVATLIEDLDIPTLFLTYSDHFFNLDVDVDKWGKPTLTVNEDVDRGLDYYRSGEAASINAMYFRNYERYVFLTITLFNDWHFLRNPIKAYQTKKALIRKTEIMQSFAGAILSDHFPQNPY